MTSDTAKLGAAPAPLEVDRDSLLELARGGNLYADRFACIRELVQNAVDATLLRLFIEKGSDAFPTHEGSMRDLRAALKAYPIDLTIERIEDEGTGDAAIHRFLVAVDDRGIGISRDDVPYLQRVGSSRKNPARGLVIESMPEWMRPSGAFGIGLQSAFLVSDELVLRSLHLSGTAIDVVLRADDGGTVQVRHGARTETGTRAEMVVRIGRAEVSDQYAPSGDPLGMRGADVSLAAALALGESIAAGALVPVRLGGRPVTTVWTSEEAVFDPEALIEIALPLTDVGAENASDPSAGSRESRRRMRQGGAWSIGEKVSGFYRGAPVSHHVSPVEFPWRYNVHFSTARALLSLGRDGFSTTGGPAVSARLMAVLQRHAPRHIARLVQSDAAPNVRCWLSVFAKDVGVPAGDDWRRIAVFSREGGPPLTLGQLADLGELVIEEPPPTVDGVHVPSTYVLPSGERLPSGTPRHALLRAALPGAVFLSTPVRRLTREPGISVGAVLLHDALASLSDEGHVRPRLPCPDAHVGLCFTWEARRDPFEHRHFGGWVTATSMMSPWTFRNGIVELSEPLRWVEWTATEYGGPPRARAEVAAGLVRFLREVDPRLRANTKLTVSYDLEAVIAELELRFPGALRS